MSCVNKSSKEFKTLAAKNNVSGNTLELIIHKYWLQTGSEENFPTDVYIQAQLGNGQYKEDISAVRKLWKKAYSHPRKFSTYEELQRAYKRSLAFFPSEAVSYHKDAKDNYILTVKEPVEKLADTPKTFFDSKNSKVRKLNLGIKENRTYGVDKVEQLFKRFNQDRTSMHLAEKVFKTVKDLGIQISFNESLPEGKLGRASNDNTITYRKSFFEDDANANLKAPILLHEMIHSVSMYALSEQTSKWQRPELIEKFRTEVNDVFNRVRNDKVLEGERGIKDVFEFVSELSNPIFRQKLQSIDNRKWYTKIVDAIKSLLGIHTSSTYYTRMMNALNDALEAFDLDGYMEYNGMKSQLQQAYNEHKVDFENMSEQELKAMLKEAINENKLRSDKKEYNDDTDRLSLHQRFSQEELRGCSGRLEEAEALLQRGGHSSTPEKSGEVTGVTWKDKEAVIAQKQIAALEKWAKEKKIWTDNTSKHLKDTYGDIYKDGGEADVYLSSDGTKVIKEIRPDYYIEPQLLLDRIVLHNYLFPDTALTVTGFGRNSKSNFVVIAEQPFIQGEYISQEEIKKYMTSMGFESYNKKGTEFINREKGVIVNDLHNENIFKTPHGYAVIDADIRLNTSNYNLGGTRVTDGNNTELSSLIDLMSKDQLISELKQIRQEFADYDLVSEPQDDSKKGRTTFAFNDGVEVKVPFTPNSQQAEALNVMNDFIHSNETSMTLSGYAGTGKTSLMEIIAQKARMDGKPIMFCATTNKAAGVLKSKVARYGFDASTLNKVFGINVKISEDGAYDTRNLTNDLVEVQVVPFSTVIIDEASMINEENYNILNRIARENHLKLIYVGDRAQLAPVGEGKVSIVFRNNDGKVIGLTKVERTDDNAILKEATNIRNGLPMSMESSFNSEGKGVAFISPKKNRQDIVKTIDHLVRGLKQDPNYFRVLAYTNASVGAYNDYIRKQLGYGATPVAGEPIMGYTNWGRDYRTKTYKVVNGESYKVVRTLSPVSKSITIGKDTIRMEAFPIIIEDSMGNQQKVEVMDIKQNKANREAAVLLANMKKSLWARYDKKRGSIYNKPILQQINAIDSFLFVNDNIIDNGGHYIQSKTFDYGYALTVHKSQGSTFTHVLLDAKDIAKAPQTVQLSSDDANVRQQLEYVGMSRATDTVTVITEEAKKEDSILNHLKEKGADMPVAESPRPEASQQQSNTINSTDNTLNNNNLNQNNNEQQTTDSRGMVQSTVPGNIQIDWRQGTGRRGSQVSQERQSGRGNSDSTGSGRNGDHVAKQVSDASDALDKKLADKNIKATKQKVRKAESQEFHDAIVEAKKQNPNGWMVDVHEVTDYDNDLCMLTEDGKAGIAVTKDGDIISVFSAVKGDRRLEKLMQMAIAAGGKKLDCYFLQGEKRGLPQIYARFGFKVESITPFNAQYAGEGYATWKLANSDKEVAGVAAMSLKVEDSIESYSLNNTPDIEAAPSFDSYDAMLLWRDNHQVALPNYELYYNLDAATPVDMAWKIPQLKELDEQLSTDNTREQNNEIIAQMNDILNAATEEDVPKTSSRKKMVEIQKDLDAYDKLNKQIDNLLEGTFSKEFRDKYDVATLEELGTTFSASEIRKVAEYIGNYISDMITKLQTEKDAAKELFPLMKFDEDVDFTKMTRCEIAERINMQNLINRTKYDFNMDNGILYFEDTPTAFKSMLALDNWDAMIMLASDVFALNEGFGIQRNITDGKFSVHNTEENQIAYDDFNGFQDEDSVNETEGDAQEHWQIESRTIDVLNSMSALVRQGLHQCYILDKDGNKVNDPYWPLPMRVNPRKATNSILRWTQGALTLEDMIAKMQEKQADNPWLSQLIARLSDKSGKETDFQSQFFGVFAKHFQLYNIVQLDNGKYVSMPVNNKPALAEAMSTINAHVSMGEHPLFSAEGKINTKLLGNEDTLADGNDFNLSQALSHLKTLQDRMNRGGEEFGEDIVKEASKWLMGSYRTLGYNVIEDMVSNVLTKENLKDLTFRLGYIVRDLISELKHQKKNPGAVYQPFAFKGRNNIGGTMRNFLTPITETLEDVAISAFYDSGKMYQSYVTPSFMTKLMQKFKLPTEQFEEFIMGEYGNSEWFKESGTEGHNKRGWRNGMLEALMHMNADERAKVFDFKVELSFNKHNYMRNMNDSEYTLSVITEYFAEGWEVKEDDVSWYRMPMQSNKPSSEYYKWYSYRDPYSYKKQITDQLYKMFLQELSRIQTVQMRNLSKKDSALMKNFDTNGRKFNFLPFLNSYLKEGSKDGRTLLRNEDNTVSADNSKLASLLQRKVEGLTETKLSAEEEAELVQLVSRAITSHMEARTKEILDNWEKSGIIEAARSIQNIVIEDDFLYEEKAKDDPERNKIVKASLENFIWNDYLAAKNILQLTVGDIAFYKDAEDLQKRLAQLHAPGTRGNTAATDYEGKRVSDGKYRTLVLKDWDNFVSNIIDNIAEIFDRKIADAPESQKASLKALKESLVGEDGAYRKINVADAQGFSSPSSYRKKAFIFGKWSPQYENIYQKLLKGEYNYSDLKTAFQPLKPFVYTHLQKDMGVADAPIHTMNVPFQAKNSEYLLIMADAIMRGDRLKGNNFSRPNLLSALYRVMEESEELNPTKGIDTIQFESAIKSGLQGAMDIHQFADMAGGEEAAYTLMMNNIYKKSEDGQRSTEYNTDVFVHEASYEDYCLQQEVPGHFKNHSQAHGSQERMIIPSDLDYYIDANGSKDDPANINYYEWTDPDGTKRKANAKEFRKEYEQTIADNIEEDIVSLQQELHLNAEASRKEKNLALSKILQREILSSPRYGVDLLQACSVDKATGEFRIPKGDPIQAKRIEQLLNSIIKNRINKQKIAGGPIVQVSNYGTSKQLNIRFKDKQGNILKTREEYEQQQGQSELQKVLSGSDRAIDEAKGILKRGDGRAVQENQLEVYARSKGLWQEGEVTAGLEEKYGKRIGHGGESWVFRKDGHTVIKAKDNTYDDVYSALESMQIHNTLFPSTKMKLVGVGRSEGELTFIIEQPYVGGRDATKKEIQDFVGNKLDGTLDESVLGGNSYENDIYKLQDLKPANVIVEPNGNLQVIDGDFYLKEEQQEYSSYEEYVKENQAGIAYFEVYAPIWSDEIFEKFADENGNIDIEALDNADPEFTKMVSYRIPTEDKYSIAPMKVVGFMPREAGDGIMLPYDLTTIDDSDFDVDKRYVMRKELDIKTKSTDEITVAMYDIISKGYAASHEGEVNKQFLKDLIRTFVANPERMSINFPGRTKEQMETMLNYLRSVYRKVAYTSAVPDSNKAKRNNKIIDMTLAVLTNAKSADKLLNPGGFEDVAKTGYMIAAYRSPEVMSKDLSWDALQAMSEDELKGLSYTSKDLAWVDTQVQFYKQNSSTSSMIGIFAVSKIAHAILESGGIYVDVGEITGGNFTIAGVPFSGRMEVDVRYDTDGNLVGKTAGSLVSASADGVKKPVLDLMNVNTSTAGVLNTMLRLGLPFKKAALFMSQDVLSRLLKEHNNRNLGNYVPLKDLIEEYISKFEEKNTVADGDNIKTEELTERELVEGLRPTEHKATDYKIMLAFQKLLSISDTIRDLTYATRFNSISSAVGPLIIDNLIMEHKMEKLGFGEIGVDNKENHLYDAEGNKVDITDIFADHPVLAKFSQAVNIARELFKDMPAGSETFKAVLDKMSDNMATKVYNDRKLLSQLSDFFQSYVLVASGLIDASELKYYIEQFPKEYVKENYQEKYPDNAFIAAIHPNVNRKSSRPFLESKITGMDTQQKEELSNAWIDLHKANPELSKKLFVYNFFRAGIGFSPKTFMSLVPMYIKERLSNGDATYVGTFRNLPDVNPDTVLKQFVRNNWSNNKLVPWKGGKGTKYQHNNDGTVTITDKADIKDLDNTDYYKTKERGIVYLWEKIGGENGELKYRKVMPLGNNKEYLEISTEDIAKPLSKTFNTETDHSPSGLEESSIIEEGASQESERHLSDKMRELVGLYMKQNPKLTKEKALERIEETKEDFEHKDYGAANFLINVFSHKGLTLDKQGAIEEFKKYC